MAVDSDFAAWLRADCLYSKATATLSSGLQAVAKDSEIISALAAIADADAENARQIAILGQTLAIDRHVIPGARRDLIGKPVTLVSGYLGYDAGVTVFVLRSDERDEGSTELSVLRRL